MELRLRVREAREAGETVSEIARRLNVTRARVQQMFTTVAWAWPIRVRTATGGAFWTGPKAGLPCHLVDTVITVSAGRGRLDRVEHPGEKRVLKRVLSHESTHRRRHREDELRPVVPVGSDVGFRIHRSQQRNIFALE